MPSFKVYKGSESGDIKEATTTLPDLTGDQVRLQITASGLCGTDIHFKEKDMVLGHEGIGKVVEVGPEVQHFKVGERVGFGYQKGSCGLCDQCLSGNEVYCPDKKMYGAANFDQGGFAEQAVWTEKFLFHIPDNISDAEAAPLMCAGSTVWTALRKYGLASTSTVGILGVGGLGHLAIQFAAQMGMNVIVLSTSESKKEEATKLGATEFVVTAGKKELDQSIQLDALIATSNVDIPWDLYLPILKPRAIIIPLTVHFGDFKIPQYPMISKGLRVQGTVVSNRYDLNEMLRFASKHGVRPVTMTFPLNKEGIEKSIKTLDEGKMRYRGVLVPQ